MRRDDTRVWDRSHVPPRVGVIVPVHGFAPYLAQTLDAVLAQDPPPDEVVVVDDASPEPLKLLPAHGARCRLLRLPQRRGLAGARAAGLDLLDCELIALCDGDDTWTPGSLRLRVAALADGAAASFGHASIVGPDDRLTGERWNELEPGVHSATGLLERLYESNPLCVSSALLRRDAVVAAGGLDSDLERAEDWDLWLRLLSRGAEFAFEPRAVVRYRRRAGGLSGDIAGLARAQLEVHARHAGLVAEAVARRARARDLRALADGLVRERRYAQARGAIADAAASSRLTAHDVVRSALLRVPGLRARLGRRDPYRR